MEEKKEKNLSGKQPESYDYNVLKLTQKGSKWPCLDC